MLALSIDGLEVRYPGLPVPALDIGSLTLEAASRVALAGPSGAGKTTFINVVTGMERAGSGKVAWNGEDLTRLSEGRRDRWRARNIGLVMQDFHLFPGLSAEANVLLPQRLSRFGLPEGMRRHALHLLERVGIVRPEQAVETMSRGQMQRVAVARALVNRPGLVVADEPTASLDAEAGQAVADLLLDLTTETGSTLIVATHDAWLIGRMDRSIRLENGRPTD
jgi:putative ABC transport system ATP-binding protein